jgi:hypothetical protein
MILIQSKEYLDKNAPSFPFRSSYIPDFLRSRLRIRSFIQRVNFASPFSGTFWPCSFLEKLRACLFCLRMLYLGRYHCLNPNLEN